MHLLSQLLPISLTRRLTLFYAIAFILFLGTSFFALYWFVGTALDNRLDEDLREDIEDFSELLVLQKQSGVVQEMEKEVIAGEHESVFLLLYRSDGSLIHSTDLEYWNGLRIDTVQLQRQFLHPHEETFETLEFPEHESATRVIYAALTPEYAMVIGESTDERDEIMELLAIAFALVFIFTLPLASLLVWLLTRQSIAGIKSVSDAATEIMAGNLDRRVNAHKQVSEVQTLADTFDAMAERIQGLIHNMREMTDNIAHDLRSPLGRIRLLSELIVNLPRAQEPYRSTAENTIAECDRLIKMIDTSLDVAETEAGVARSTLTHFDLVTLVQDACELFESVAEENKLVLAHNLQSSVQMLGDVNGIQRMVANLLDNAIKHTPEGGRIDVEIRINDYSIEITVIDSGIGIDECNYESIFNRFYRVDPSRSDAGCGLGLSYSRAVARAHGGDIQVRSEKNKYTAFTVVIPYDSAAQLLPPASLVAVG